MDAAVIVFIVFAYVLAIALSSVIWLTGGHESPLLFLSLISMFIPAAAVVAARFATGEKLHVDWDLPPKRYFPLALFLMPATMHAVMLSVTVFLTGEVPWQDWLTDHANGVFHSPMQLGWGTLNSTELAFHLITNAIFGLLLVSFLAFFEEIGWRVWLLQRLAGGVSQRKAITVVAIIWALWHVPFVLSGILYFANVSRSAATAIMPVGEFGAGLVIGWFWIRTRSIWIVSLAHGALNDWGQYAFKFMKDVPVSVFGTVYRSYDTIALASGSVALVVLGGLLVFSCIPNARTSERLSDSLTDIQ
jgi:membrane protease YdiL (CAAX protease family)